MYTVKNKIINYYYNKKSKPENYPKKFKYIIDYCEKDNSYLDIKFKKSKINQKKNIKLASKYIYKSSKNFWKNLNFIDDEDKSYMHRWSWALNLIFEKKKFNNKKFISSNINNWFFYHQNNEFNNEKVEWYSYNISERVSNYVLLCEYKVIKKDKLHIKHLTAQMHFLTRNIEFFKGKKSNHSLNNARAIFLLSCLNDNKIFKKFSFNLILFLCKEFMDSDGFFRFGSSHYQFIFTKWLSEVYYFGKKYKVNRIAYLKKYLDRSINACNFFIQKNKYGKLTFPLFGNISPDFTPEFLLNYLNFKKKKNFLINDKISNKKIEKNKEWIKLQNKFQTLYFRNPMVSGFDFNHAHSDFFHFVSFYKGNPIFVDIGRKNYLKNNSHYSLSEAHNSIIINQSSIFNKFIKTSFFNKIGLNELDKNIYKVYKQNNKVIFKASLNKKLSIIRSFKLTASCMIIENVFKNIDDYSKIDFPLFLDSSLSLKKVDKNNILLTSKLMNSSISFVDEFHNSRFEVVRKKNVKFSQCKSYGEMNKVNLINLNSYGQKNFKIIIKLNF